MAAEADERPESLTVDPVGVIHSCYGDKFGTPRQPGLVPAAQGVIRPFPPYDRVDWWRDLDQFSHIWVLFWFHQVDAGNVTPTVRPPRLGGNRRVGVFASRSPFRPNPIGLSVLRLDGVDCRDGGVTLRVSGIDLIDGTPVLDVKPYLPYADALAEARAGFAAAAPAPQFAVHFSTAATVQIDALAGEYPTLASLIRQTLSLDPRPAYRSDDVGGDRVYGFRLLGVEVRWRIRGDSAEVVSVGSASDHGR